MILLAYTLAVQMHNSGVWALFPDATPLVDLPVLLVSGLLIFRWLGLHRIKLNAYEATAMVQTALVGLAMSVAGLTAARLLGWSQTGWPVFVIFGMLYAILSVGARLALRRVVIAIYFHAEPRMRLLIYGAGRTGQQLATALSGDYNVHAVAFLDDNQRIHRQTVAGLRVHPPGKVRELVRTLDIDRIVLAMPSASDRTRAAILTRLRDVGCEVHSLPSLSELVAGKAERIIDTRPVDVNELLGRDRFQEDLPGVADTYRDRAILVTGAGGSIGSELCRQMITCAPRRLVLLDHSELSLFEIDRELRDTAPELEIVPVLGSVCDAALMDEIMASQKIDIVLHAAAYKHVPMVECNALVGVQNNVFGTRVVAQAARAAGIERFILVSTDKAVRPSSIMGASKRFAEQIVQDLATRSRRTRFAMVRFGNVLGSSGSVIPLFQEQIARGGPVTVTHSDITRYFMTIPEAVHLVLLAGSFARGGDVFVLDMGKPVPIRQLARQLIETAGLTVRDEDNPGGDIEIHYTGMRPGEKLHEELLIGSDMLTTPHPKILRAQEDHLSELEMANALQSLRQAIEARSTEQLKATMAQWIEKTDPEDITAGGEA